MSDIPNKDILIAKLIGAGPYGLLTAVLVLVAMRWDDVPVEVLSGAIQNAPWLICVTTLIWLVTWLVGNHKEREDHLVSAIERMSDTSRDVIIENTKSNVSLQLTVEELRGDLKSYKTVG
jgi:hypothetical protein